ncbi:peptidase M50B-like protein [Salsuginibacillus halophilus]|uniref:Peptidase M50B-like protein n=1 Tax=Salsuginibacillus halophilus TaxID=517424 RepID=A0A2P8H3Q2_9BACI|nr:M50 family metallopeptidase [Salsuginibacillus halophilus]PSL40848.1 peptidase M50B-like protein [Salsuginibacillus halophilus]
MEEQTMLALFIILVTIVSHLPWIGPYISLFQTLLHETGHALTAWLGGGRVHSVSLFHTTAGEAVTMHRGRLEAVLTTFAGYPFASLLSVLAVAAVQQGWEIYVGGVWAALLLFALLFWIRNLVGWFWGASALALLVACYMYMQQSWFETSIQLLAIAVWIQALTSAWVVFWLSIRVPEWAGDAAILAARTRVPAQVWGTIFLCQALVWFALGGLMLAGYEPEALFTWLFEQFV